MGIDRPGQRAGNHLNPDGKIPFPLTLGLALQLAGLVLPGIVLIPTIVFQAAGESETVLLWAVFASLMVCGVATMLQALRIGRMGTGYILSIGTSGVAIAVSITALEAGGPSLLATLVLALALFQFAFSTRLSLFRRILTPTVTGTVIMLTPVTVMPFIFELLQNVPEEANALAGPLSAFTTMLIICCIVLRAGVACACGRRSSASWPAQRCPEPLASMTLNSWPGLPGSAFRTLHGRDSPSTSGLPSGTASGVPVCRTDLHDSTISGSIAIQHVSWPTPRTADFRAVQGAVTADGVGNFLSGLTGTMPVGFRPTGASMVEITGISSRHIGLRSAQS